MNEELAELHDELRRVARDVLGKATPLVGDGGAPPPVDWSLLAQMGWLGLEVPEALGGAGATFAEVAVVLEELGRTAATGPYLGTAVLGVGALVRAEPNDGRDELLRRVAAGELRLATVLGDGSDARPAPAFVLRATGDGLRLDGRAELVLDVPDADRLLVLARDERDAPVLVVVAPDAPGIAVTAQALVDATRTAGTVLADGAAVEPGSVLRIAGDGEAAVAALADRAALAVAIDSLGLSRAMLDATVTYAGARRQFGRAIGSFQAVKHACADMLVHVSVTEELVRVAVADLVREAPDASVSASMAKVAATERAVAVAGKAMQLHGGIGYAWESGIHVYLKRATLDRSLVGSPVEHRRRLAVRLTG